MPAVTPFPFTKLPPEIQLKVLRYAMPPHGILPRIPHEASDSVDQDEDWSPDDASAFWEYHGQFEDARSDGAAIPSGHCKLDRTITTDANDIAIPLSFFRVDRYFAAVARPILITEVPFVINFTSTCMHFISRLFTVLHEYPSYQSFADIPHFQHMQTFELNLDFDRQWWSEWFEEPLNSEEEIWWARPKENLRTICDILTTKHKMHHLIVRLPCLCSLTTPRRVEQASSVMLDLLSPLRRLCIANAVCFIWRHQINKHKTQDHKIIRAEGEANNESQTQEAVNDTTRFEAMTSTDTHVCTQALGADLIKTLQVQLGQLKGEKLSHREAIWKTIKAMDRKPLEDDDDTRLDFGERLDELHDCLKSKIFTQSDGSESESEPTRSTEIPDSSQDSDDEEDSFDWATADRHAVRTFDTVTEQALRLLRNRPTASEENESRGQESEEEDSEDENSGDGDSDEAEPEVDDDGLENGESEAGVPKKESDDGDQRFNCMEIKI